MSQRLSAFCRMDQVVLEARRGDCATDRSRIAFSISERDRREQALVRRMFEDQAFGARCAAMSPAEWEDFLDAECGRRPGRMGARRVGDMPHREAPEPGLMSLFAAAEMIGCHHRCVWGYVVDGVVPVGGGERVRLEAERINRQLWTRREWVEAFLAEVPWVRRAEGEVRNCGRKAGREEA